MYLTPDKKLKFTLEEIDELIEEKAEVAEFLGKTENPAQVTVFTNKYVYLEIRMNNLRLRARELQNEIDNAV